MIYSGLTSVTFRKLSPKEIVNLVSQAKLDAIEWGGDIHVPPGELKNAVEVYKLTHDKGLKVSSYGSYYKFIEDNDSLDQFKHVLETATKINATTIRVWAGNKGSAEADESNWNKIVERSLRAGEEASKAGMSISYEFHGGTITDTNEAANKLMNSVRHESIKTYWQMNMKIDFQQQKEGLYMVLPRLSNIHVFSCMKNDTGGNEKMDLEHAKDSWTELLKIVSDYQRDKAQIHYAILEFVKNDSPEQFLKDALTLRELLMK